MNDEAFDFEFDDDDASAGLVVYALSDDDFVLSVIEEALEGEDATIRLPRTLAALERALDATPPDLVVLDVGDGESDRWRRAELIRDASAHTKIVAIAEALNFEIEELGEEHDVWLLLDKSDYDLDQLAEILRERV